MAKIEIYTDGSCKPSNPGPAGYGVAVVVDDLLTDIISQYIGEATNNIAEISGIKRGLEYLESKGWEWETVTIYTDSQYAIGLFTKNWKAKKNQELVAEVRTKLENFPNLNFVWVKGHSNNEFNDLVDDMANQAVDHKMNQHIDLVNGRGKQEHPQKENYCCKLMEQQLEYDCPDHKNNCPDQVIKYNLSGRLSLVAPNAMYDLSYCPWCGKKVQEEV